MNVLSLFDGISACHLALTRAGIEVDTYYTAEIDKYATQISKHHYPNAIRFGDVTKWQEWDIDWSSIDLITAGSPCQGFSRSGAGLNFNDTRSCLFFVFIDILNHAKAVNPGVKFLLENVVMKKEWEQVITDYVGVPSIEINSALVSAQKRPRKYWTNIQGFTIPQDLNIALIDIFDTESEIIDAGELLFKKDGVYCVKNATKKGYLEVENGDSVNLDFPNSNTRRGRVGKGKANTLNTGCNQAMFFCGNLFKFSPVVCERLQNYPDNYTALASDAQRRKMIGNGWTIGVIAIFFKALAVQQNTLKAVA